MYHTCKAIREHTEENGGDATDARECEDLLADVEGGFTLFEQFVHSIVHHPPPEE